MNITSLATSLLHLTQIKHKIVSVLENLLTVKLASWDESVISNIQWPMNSYYDNKHQINFGNR